MMLILSARAAEWFQFLDMHAVFTNDHLHSRWRTSSSSSNSRPSSSSSNRFEFTSVQDHRLGCNVVVVDRPRVPCFGCRVSIHSGDGHGEDGMESVRSAAGTAPIDCPFPHSPSSIALRFVVSDAGPLGNAPPFGVVLSVRHYLIPAPKEPGSEVKKGTKPYCEAQTDSSLRQA